MRILVERWIAFMIDWTVLFTALAAPQFLIMVLSGRWFLDEESSHVLTWAWVGVSVTLPSYIYFVVADRSGDGMTIGKRVLGIAVRDRDGSRIATSQAALRNVVKLLPWEATHVMIFFPEPFGDELTAGKIMLMTLTNVLLLAWLLAPILDRPRYRALHDRATGSIVVRGRNLVRAES